MSTVAACIPTLGPLLRGTRGASYMNSLKLPFFSSGSGPDSADQKKAYEIGQQGESSHAKRAWQESDAEITHDTIGAPGGATRELEMYRLSTPKV